jgi:hypothetical protein
MSLVITEDRIIKAQQDWADALVDIGSVFTAGGDYRKIAEKHLDRLYGYAAGPVLFKPTRAAVNQFRTTRKGALSYFVGGDPDFPEDHGFALQPWQRVRFENIAISIHGEYGVAMGNYFFTGSDGIEVKVEYSFGYCRDAQGELKINLHHSSMPWQKEGA